MEKLSMCRVCLEEDIRLHSIVETHLQEMYESLVLMPFETKDRRPILICYTCRAKLQNCYELRKSCLQSEELFTQMLSCDELEPVELQEVDNEKKLSVVYNVEHLSMGQVLQMSADNVGVEALTFDDVKVEQNDTEDIDEDALEDYSVYDNIQSADSDDDTLIIVKVEQSEDRMSDPTPKECDHAAQRNSEDLTPSNLREHDFGHDMFKELHTVTAADKTAAKSTNEVTFPLNDNNKERSTTVPHSKCVQYTCDTCQQCYSSKCNLERHIRLCSDVWKKDLSRENSTSSHTHTGQRPHQCHVCEKSFSRMSHLTGHMRTHTGEKPYHCSMCEKSYSQKKHVNRHMLTHTGEKPYHCDICRKQFSQRHILSCHMRTHTGEKPYHCEICNKQFSQKYNLSGHMRTHTGQKPHPCNVCKKSFSRTSHLARHIRTHTGEKPHQCNVCGKLFSNTSDLSDHMHTHTGEKPYQCSMCKKSFLKNCYLNTHMRTHTGEKLHQCNVCKKYYTRADYLIRHMRSHTGEKPYHCEICKKSFLHKNYVIHHMRTHTGEKPYQCSECGKCFSYTSHLSNHKRTHTGEKPHQCSICKKNFLRNGHLIRHMRTHTGEKPYHCSVCKKCFSTRGNLTTHIRTHVCKKQPKQKKSPNAR